MEKLFSKVMWFLSGATLHRKPPSFIQKLKAQGNSCVFSLQKNNRNGFE